MLRRSDDCRLLRGRNGAFFLHEVALGDVFFFDLVKLVDVFFHIGFEYHEVVDEILVITPQALCVSIVLDETEFFFAVMMEYDTALLGLQCKCVVHQQSERTVNELNLIPY